MASGPITSWQIHGEKVEILTDSTFVGSKIVEDNDCSHEIKRRLLLGIQTMTNLYAGQEATVRTGHGTDWTGKGVHQGCILSSDS